MTTDDEQDRLARLLALALAGPEGGDALDPNDVAQLAAGRPSDAVRAALEARLAGAPCEDRAAVAAVAGAAPLGDSRSPRRLSWGMLATAAAILAVIGSIWAFQPPSAPAILGDEALLAGWASLGGEVPERLAGIGPLVEADRLNAESPLRRGGLRIYAPAGASSLGSPRVRWQTLPGAESYLVQILSDEGEVVVHNTETSSSLPPAATAGLKPGAYVVSVSTVVSGVRVRGSSAFRVSSQVEVEQYQGVLRAIDAAEPAALRPVLRAHLAIRLGLIEEARVHVGLAGDEGAARGLLAQTRAYLQRRYGSE